MRSAHSVLRSPTTYVLGSVALSAVLLLVLLGQPRDPTFAALMWLPLSATTFAGAFAASRHVGMPADVRRAWTHLSVGLAALGVANALWVVAIIRPNALGDWALGVAYLAAYALMLRGVLGLVRRGRARDERLLFVIDAAVVMVSVAMGGWELYLRPAFIEGGASALWVQLLWLLGDALIVYGAVLVLLSKAPRGGRRAVTTLALALLANSIADIIYNAQPLHARVLVGWLTNGLWIAAYIAIPLAAVQQLADQRTEREDCDVEAAVLQGWQQANPIALAGLVAGYAIFLVSSSDHLFSARGAVVVGAVLLTALVTVRQLVGARENARLREERASARVEARFRALIEQASDLVAILDAGLVVRYMSPASERMLGLHPDDCVGSPALALVHGDDREIGEELLAARSGVHGAVRHAELRLRASDGSWRPVSATAVNLLADPAVAGVVVTVRDESARRRAEAALRERDEQLRQVQKMDAVGRLAGGIAHDFNNVLTAIRCSAELLLSDIEEGTPAWDDAQEILRSSGRAAELTGQLLTFSRRRVTEAADVDVNAVVSDMQRMLDRLLDKGIVIKLDLGRLGGAVRIDPGQLQQVVMNLAVNARDAMPDGGMLGIETRHVEIGAGDVAGRRAGLTPGRYVALSVRDTGHGMDGDTLARLFEPFFTTKPKGQGTGLGLSIVYGIVRQCGGQVDVASVPGVGTTFTVLLPLCESPDAEPPAVREPVLIERGENGYVLVVDDQEPVRTAARRMLERAGLVVRTAADGSEALALIAALHAPPQLLVTDMMMPVVSGAELVRRIRVDHPELPILCMSGYTEDHAFLDELRAQNATAAFLAKPFTSDELLTLVEGLIGLRVA